MRDKDYLERAVKGHGPYAVAVRSLTESLRCLCVEGCGEVFDTRKIENGLRLIIRHIKAVPGCPECNLRLGLLPFERVCLDAIGRFEQSKNGRSLDGLSIQVFIADGQDYVTVNNPLAEYAAHLRQRILRAVVARTYGRYRQNPAKHN